MKFINTANQAEPDAETHFFRGNRYQIQNDPANAILCYQRAIDLNPDFAEAHYNMGNAYQDLNMADQAIGAYQKSLELEPDNINAYNNLGIIRQELADPAAAMQCFQKALDIVPDSARTCYNIARLYSEQGNLTEATWYYQRALKIQPGYAKAFNGLGIVLQECDRFSCSIICFQEALKLKPDYFEAYFNMGVSFQKLGSLKDALRCYDNALTINPDFPHALWYYLLSLPTIYESADEIHTHRRRFEEGLERLISKFILSHPDQKKAALAGIGSTTNFYLQYQGFNDFPLQKKYGRYVCNVMQANFPQWAQPKQMPPRTPNERIRLGYISSYMASHTVGKLFLGWVENANRHDFEIYCYHINKPTDQLTEQYKHQSDHFYHIYGDIAATARQIISDNLNILVFTDIGMFPPATQLAGLRLAPIQCTGWGHPVTTGLPTIDYYLSSDLMEPEGAQKYYSEKLVRLPNIALAYKKPNQPLKPKTRKDLGLKKKAFIYLCPQSLFKYLPQHDYIFPRIAQKVPGGQFVFIANAGVEVSRKFRNRLARAFEEHGLKLEKYCLFLPRMNHDDFMSLNLASDVLLDTLGWSGGHTTLEGISCGLPVVTLPGQFMRGRHAFAMLKMMGITESIARDEKDYVEIAARLAVDRSRYLELKQRMQANQYRLYNDVTCIRMLEKFYRSVISPNSD